MRSIYGIVVLLAISVSYSKLRKSKGNYAKIESINVSDALAYAYSTGNGGAQADSCALSGNNGSIDQRKTR
jgi:hypothetical protein